MYRLTGRLEQSQLADLYRAERAGEAVVVKLFHLKTSDAAYARVVGEVARQLQAVPHPGVARVLDVGLVDGQLAIVRQDAGKYTLGLALQRLNTREVHLPPALALALALELLDAVGAAHEAGVVHGALTPGNIVLGVDGQISATDFGALRALEASPALKKSFGARGRSSYRAPELSTGGEPTVASDVYALGAITYELLTLREASTGHSTVSTRAERLPPPSRLVRRLHSRIDPVIMRALEPSAPRRHRSCRDFAEGIREFLASSGGMPGKADLAKFVSELFPNEVQVAATGPVPIERPFELTDIAGVGAIEAEAVEADDRKSFSGGFVDDRTPTSDGLPVFTGEPAPETLTETPVKTELEVAAVPKRAVSDWEAPPGELPATASQSGPTPRLNEALKGRMKAVEDFGEIPGQEKAPPRELPPEQAPRTIVSFVVPGQKPIDRYAIAQEERAIAERRVQRVRVMGALILTGTVLFVAWSWYRGQSDPKGALISYLPDPIERQIAPDTAPVASPVKSSNPLKLADFDKLHPEKAFHPETPTPAPPPEKKPVAVAPKKAGDCFDPPSSGKLGYLTVAAMTSVRVDVDGKRVCVNATKLPLSVGSHKVKVTDVKSKQEDVSTIRVEAGKLVKLSPVFPKR